MVVKIISGGQTGADKLGLEVGRKLSLETGGTAPLGWKTENGPDYTLESFGLVQSEFSGYEHRTVKNIEESDATVLFGDDKSPGSKLTKSMCKAYHKECLVNPTSADLKSWFIKHNVEVLNVAGNRASKLSEKQLAYFEQILTEALS